LVFGSSAFLTLAGDRHFSDGDFLRELAHLGVQFADAVDDGLHRGRDRSAGWRRRPAQLGELVAGHSRTRDLRPSAVRFVPDLAVTRPDNSPSPVTALVRGRSGVLIGRSEVVP